MRVMSDVPAGPDRPAALRSQEQFQQVGVVAAARTLGYSPCPRPHRRLSDTDKWERDTIFIIRGFGSAAV